MGEIYEEHLHRTIDSLNYEVKQLEKENQYLRTLNKNYLDKIVEISNSVSQSYKIVSRNEKTMTEETDESVTTSLGTYELGLREAELGTFDTAKIDDGTQSDEKDYLEISKLQEENSELKLKIKQLEAQINNSNQHIRSISDEHFFTQLELSNLEVINRELEEELAEIKSRIEGLEK